MRPLKIGLFGFGVVGEGIYQVLQQSPGLGAQVKKICIKHPNKERAAPKHLFTTDYNELLQDPEINLIVELIDDADEAYKIVTTAFGLKKSVISANKKMIGENLPRLIELQQEHSVSFLYEAAVCGSIPIIRNLEEYFDHDLLQSVAGIVNGSTNYILTQIANGESYTDALLEAQQKGFAESNPALDVEGWDAANKLSILLTHAHGLMVAPKNILRLGITRLHTVDAAYAKEKNLRIKLVAQTVKRPDGKVAAFVMPQYVPTQSQLSAVNDEYNGVVIATNLADKQFFYGKGAGRFPTSSAVVSDISALKYGYRYEYKKLAQQPAIGLATDVYVSVFVSFPDWQAINKWDFEEVTEWYAGKNRQFLKGIILLQRLADAAWFQNHEVSVVLQPEAIVTGDQVLEKTLRKVSLQLGGVHF